MSFLTDFIHRLTALDHPFGSLALPFLVDAGVASCVVGLRYCRV
jgi:hypothetical protein